MDVAQTGFEDFKVEARTSAGGSTQISSDSGSAIVANLGDLTKLGASAILHASSVQESEEGSQYWGPSMVTDDTMSHLGAFADNAAPLSCGFDARIAGIWEGKTSKELGGYDQRIQFHNDCVKANITVLGQTMDARFRVNCSVEPCQLDIEVLPKGSSCPPPALPYIFKFGPQGSLYLCGPADKRLQRPTSFEGPGLCIMERVDHAMPMPMLRQESVPTQMSFEPDPEFSRNTTESCKDQLITAPNKELIKTNSSKSVIHWIEEQPAMAASMALALTSTIIALRKSI